MSELQALKLLRRIDEGVAGKSGEAYFRQIVRDIAEALNAHAAFTSRLLPERRAVMLAFWCGDRYEKNLEYSLDGTPCEFVYSGKITGYARDIGNVFPVDRKWFEELGVNSYLGIPIMDEHGAVCGHLAVMDRIERDWHDADVDILRIFSLRTAVELERSKAQRMLEESNESLQRMNEQLRLEVEHRIAMEKELAEAKAAAEKANQAKSVFISQMSHELRTPLNGILGYAQLLRRDVGTLTEQQRDGLGIIERSGEHLLNLVNDLLDLAKIEAGRLDLRDEEIELAELLQHVIDLVRVRAEKAGLEFRARVAEGLPQRLRADARALRQILLNLLGNAVKFTNAGGRVELRVLGGPRTDDAFRLRFEVADSGIGMPADQLARIFEPFHRIDNAGRIVEGTGLGLAITKRLIDAMQGEISVASVPGEGTTFGVDLDVFVAELGSRLRHEGRRVVGYTGERLRVLVADDDGVNRRLVCDLLEGLGFEVQAATDGRDALERIGVFRPRLIVTDLRMPYVDGIELTRAVRAQPLHSQVAIMAISASASEYTSHEAITAGCDAFVAKPLRLATFLDEVGRVLGVRWQTATDIRDATPVPPHRTAASEFSMRRELADELYHLAMLGDITTLVDRATEALSCDPAAGAFCEELRMLAHQYDTGAIRRILKSRITAA